MAEERRSLSQYVVINDLWIGYEVVRLALRRPLRDDHPSGCFHSLLHLNFLIMREREVRASSPFCNFNIEFKRYESQREVASLAA